MPGGENSYGNEGVVPYQRGRFFAAGKDGYNKERTALRERINSILREDSANGSSPSYKSVPEQNVTVVLPRDEMPVLQEETVVTEQPAASSSEEAALGNYLNR